MEHGIQRTGTCPTGYVELCRQGWLLRGAPHDTPRAMPNQGSRRPVSGNQTDIVAFSFEVLLN